MAKYVYVGDPTKPNEDNKPSAHASGRTTFVDREHNRQFTFKQGEAVEVPDWLEPRLKNNTHFKAVGAPAKADEKK